MVVGRRLREELDQTPVQITKSFENLQTDDLINELASKVGKLEESYSIIRGEIASFENRISGLETATGVETWQSL